MQRKNNSETRKAAANSTYKKLAVQWLNEALCFVSSSVVADSFRLRNRQLLVAAKRYVQGGICTININADFKKRSVHINRLPLTTLRGLQVKSLFSIRASVPAGDRQSMTSGHSMFEGIIWSLLIFFGHKEINASPTCKHV